MKVFWQIALFFFIIQTFGAVLVQYAPEMGLKAVIYADSDATTAEALQELEDNKEDVISGNDVTGTDPVSGALGWFYQQITNVATTIFSKTFPIFKAVAWLPFYMMSLGIPSAFAWTFFSIVTVIEIIAFYEMLTGRDIL